MINSHAHLDFETMDAIEQNAVAVVPSIGKQNWTDVQMYPYFAFGIHPWTVESHTVQDLEHLEYLIKCNNPIAIGECGLDFYKDIDRLRQLFFFDAQVKLALTYDLPLIIHGVKATEEIILTLKKNPKLSGEIHDFSGSESQAVQLTKLGFYLGFGLKITNKEAHKARQIVQNCPLEFILIETDDHKNPNDLRLVAEEIALLKKISLDAVISQCDNNAISLFKLK